MNHRHAGTALSAIVTCALSLLLAGTAAAQSGAVGLEGRVAWIAAGKMVVAPLNGLPVSVDLSQVDLEQYRAVRPGDRVIVTGTVSPERDRLLARSVQSLEVEPSASPRLR